MYIEALYNPGEVRRSAVAVNTVRSSLVRRSAVAVNTVRSSLVRRSAVAVSTVRSSVAFSTVLNAQYFRNNCIIF